MKVSEFKLSLPLKPLIAVSNIKHPKVKYLTAFDEDLPTDIFENSVRISKILKEPDNWIVDTNDVVTTHVVYSAISTFAIVRRHIGICGLQYNLYDFMLDIEYAKGRSKQQLFLNVLEGLKKRDIKLK